MKSNKSSNMALEDILQELTKYGRPTVHQSALNASGGSSAGVWYIEVWIPSKWDRNAPAGVSNTGRRMIGKGTLIEAANECLNNCQELAESDLASWYSFVSEDEIRKIEANKNNLKIMLDGYQLYVYGVCINWSEANAQAERNSDLDGSE